MTNKDYAWAVVGAGPGGITAVGLLLDSGVPSDKVLWIDPHFQVGDFGQWWGEVNSNTRVSLFQNYLNGVKNFDYANKEKSYALVHQYLSAQTHPIWPPIKQAFEEMQTSWK